jgi:hypothetical protein
MLGFTTAVDDSRRRLGGNAVAETTGFRNASRTIRRSCYTL